MHSIQFTNRTLAGGLALLLAAGCADLSPRATQGPTPVNPPPATQAAPASRDRASAIDAALARGTATGVAPAAATAGGRIEAPVLNADAPKQYTVKRGDTLWGIAAIFLRDPWLWPEIWHVNPAISNPHLIYPGDRLTLAYGADGRPVITIDRDGAAAQGGTRVEPLVRSSALGTAIPAIPSATIAGFIGKPLLLGAGQRRSAPHVVALQERHVAVGAPHEVFVTGLAGAAPGRYSVVRVGQALRDPATHKLLGYLGIHTGTARVDAPARLSRATLVESARETVAGDLVLPEDAPESADIVPRVPQARIDGQIIAVVDGVTMIGQYQVVAINRGARQGLEPGHVLTIHAAGETVRDRRDGQRLRLPETRNGTLLVFRTYQDVSYGLTVNVTAPIRIEDHVRTP
ncbi:MAG: hypothetical protein RLZZ393_1861 [Pseudomonadota bacterium]